MVSRQDIIKLLALLLVATLFLVACERPLQNAGQTAEELATQVAEEAEQAEEGVEEAEATPEPAAEEEAQEEITATEPAPTEVPATDDTPEAEDTPVAEEEVEEGEEASPRTGGDEEEETPEATEEGAAEGAEEEAATEEPAGEETAEAESEETTAEETADAEAEEEAAEEEAAEPQTEEEADAGAEVEEEAAEEEAAETAEEQEATEAQTSAVRTHIVQPGENLYRIGLQYGISWVVLADYNNISNPNSIYVGQELQIPPSDDETEEPTPTPTPSPATETTYIVKPGDNLYRIGRAFNIDWVQIAEANGIVNPNHIVVGQELKIPAEAPGPAPQFTHTVRQGETLFTISLRYGVPWTTIAEANDLTSPYVIYPGQTLVIPGG